MYVWKIGNLLIKTVFDIKKDIYNLYFGRREIFFEFERFFCSPFRRKNISNCWYRMRDESTAFFRYRRHDTFQVEVLNDQVSPREIDAYLRGRPS